MVKWDVIVKGMALTNANLWILRQLIPLQQVPPKQKMRAVPIYSLL